MFHTHIHTSTKDSPLFRIKRTKLLMMTACSGEIGSFFITAVLFKETGKGWSTNLITFE